MLTEANIASTASDKELFDALSRELERRLPPEVHEEYETYVQALRQLPVGLRAMAATHPLDVSMAHDDLGCHFYNCYDEAFCEETLNGLKELEAYEAAEVFEHAYALVREHRQHLGELRSRGWTAFADWYYGSDLEKKLQPLNARMWALCEAMPEFALMTHWLRYARKFPWKVVALGQ